MSTQTKRTGRGSLFIPGVAAGLALAAAVGFVASGMEASESDTAELGPTIARDLDIDSLVEEERRTALKALRMIDESAEHGWYGFQHADFIRLYSLRLLGSELYSIEGDPGVRTFDPELYLNFSEAAPTSRSIAAFEEHLRRMKVWEDRLLPLARDGTLPPVEFLYYKLLRLDAEVWLARELERSESAGEEIARRGVGTGREIRPR